MEFPIDLRIELSTETVDFEPGRELTDFECYPSRDVSRALYGSWLLSKLPDAFADHDQPPYHKSFVKVYVRAQGILVQVFGIRHFGRESYNAEPISQWDIPYQET